MPGLEPSFHSPLLTALFSADRQPSTDKEGSKGKRKGERMDFSGDEPHDYEAEYQRNKQKQW